MTIIVTGSPWLEWPFMIVAMITVVIIMGMLIINNITVNITLRTVTRRN